MESAEFLCQGQTQLGDMDLQRKILSTAHLLQDSIELDILSFNHQGIKRKSGPDWHRPCQHFCNKCFIYWEFCYQVSEDKNVTELQGQTTRLIIPFY